MALFSLLIALIIERTVDLDRRWQFQYWFDKNITWLRSFFEQTSVSFQLLTVLLPTLLTYVVLNLLQGMLFGMFSLIFWVLIVLLCVGCIGYRQLYKKYLVSVCHNNFQSSYHLAAQLADVNEIDVENANCLGTRVGRQLAWINYRFYCAVVFMMIIGGPVAVVFYASLRTLDLMMFQQRMVELKYIKKILFILDWIPARLVALAYVLVGNFSNAISVWLGVVLNVSLPAYDVVSRVAMAAEQMSKQQGDDGVCMQSTYRLVRLAKRTLTLLVGVMSFLTIFGYLI